MYCKIVPGHKQAGVAIPIANKIDFKLKLMKRDEKEITF